MTRPDLEWTGEWVEIEKKMWWCPTHNQWGECDGPCPDGTPHEVWRIEKIMARRMRISDG